MPGAKKDPAADPVASLRAVDRAAYELRRGRPVCVAGDEGAFLARTPLTSTLFNLSSFRVDRIAPALADLEARPDSATTR